jgi:ATP-dependent Clp protease ATP-binding subunit ClpA
VPSREELHRLEIAAFEESARLGHKDVGADHLLLALCASGEDTAAARALQAAGVEYESIPQAMARHREGEPPPWKEQRQTPDAFHIAGIAIGLATGLGAERVEAEHLLLAILWEPNLPANYLLARLAPTRAEILSRLVAEGVRIPREPLPDLWPVPEAEVSGETTAEG